MHTPPATSVSSQEKNGAGDLVTVIVPVYNVEKYLSRCLESIVNQTYRNLEIILVDDGSTDSSGEICDEYASKDKRIIVIHKENGGLSSARNAGLDICSYGSYLMFVDSDDYLDVNAIEILIDHMQHYDADMVVFNFYATYENKKFLINTTGECEHSTDEIKDKLIFDYWLNSVWDKFYKSDIYKDIRFPNGLAFEDAYVMPEVLSKCKVITCLKDALYFYNRGNGISITKSVKVRNVFDVYKGWRNRLNSKFLTSDKQYLYCFDKALYFANMAYYFDFKSEYLTVREKEELLEFLKIKPVNFIQGKIWGNILYYKMFLKKILSGNYYLWIFWKRYMINR